MIEVKIKDKWYNIPIEYTELTISKYQNYIEVVQNKNQFKNDFEFISNVISVIIELDIDILLKLQMSDIEQLKRALSFLNEDLTLSDDSENKGTITIDNTLYMFNKNMNNLTMGEYIDLDILTKEPIKNLHKLMCLMYRPIKSQNILEKQVGKYELVEYDNDYIDIHSEKFKNISILDATKCLSFFLHFQVLYTKATQICLDQVLAKMEKKNKKRKAKKIEPNQ